MFKKFVLLSVLLTFCISFAMGTALGASKEGVPKKETGLNRVTVANNTDYRASGKVIYVQVVVCKNDDYSAPAKGSWTARSRGVCRVRRITANLETNAGNIKCKEYNSVAVGTTYSQFYITMTGDKTCEVKRAK